MSYHMPQVGKISLFSKILFVRSPGLRLNSYVVYFNRISKSTTTLQVLCNSSSLKICPPTSLKAYFAESWRDTGCLPPASLEISVIAGRKYSLYQYYLTTWQTYLSNLISLLRSSFINHETRLYSFKIRLLSRGRHVSKTHGSACYLSSVNHVARNWRTVCGTTDQSFDDCQAGYDRYKLSVLENGMVSTSHHHPPVIFEIDLLFLGV